VTSIGLPTEYQSQIHQTKYARWSDELGRRETWAETVERYMAAIQRQSEKHGFTLNGEYEEIQAAIQGLELVPSMRALMTAGPALDKDNVASYNCAYLAINRVHAFDEVVYILMCGTGVGYSVERQYTNQLPEVPDLYPVEDVIVVADSKIGWASAYRRLLGALYAGAIPSWNLSKLRPAGARLKTFGGRSSGPGPLDELFRYTVNTFRQAQGRKLTSLECHGILCKIGDIVVVGGVRRSALLSLSNPSDDRMRDAKAGQWWQDNPHYALANNSAAWTEKPSMERFLDEWISLIKSKSGERGIISRDALKKQAAKYGRRDPNHEFGVNPCSEIILRDRQTCNLTEVIVRPGDTEDELFRKVRLATILGTVQSTYTDFRYLSAQWKKNCEEERLLGVSLTGVMAHPILSQVTDEAKDLLSRLRIHAVETNAIWAEKLGINPATAITCNKPSGNTSELALTHASGLHAGHSKFRIRTNRANKSDPVAQMLRDQGVPCEDEIHHPDTTWVLSWPMKAPDGLVTRSEMTAVKQLEVWLMYAEYWCEHKPSVTVSVKDDEWLEAGAFVYKHWDEMSGVSFLPYSDHIYQQAPLQEITEAEYDVAVAAMPTEIDWSKLVEYELEDSTESARELACTGGSCEIAW
jgi:ribonucleoside-triphosphate reductase